VKARSLLAGAAFTVVSGIGATALAQGGDLDFTMQVIDDTRDLGRVLDTVASRAAAERSPDGSRPSPGENDEAPPLRELDSGVLATKDQRDRDEQSEGELDDYDLPEDAEVDD
jgi:hypothetical protein